MKKEYPFGSELKRLRKLKYVTLRELAQAMGGYSISYLSDVEHGRRLPPAPYLVARIERRLGVADGSLECFRVPDKTVRALALFTDDELQDELIQRAWQLEAETKAE